MSATAKYMTIDEINTYFVNEWVLLVEPQVDESQNVQGGLVAAHNKDRDEVYRSAASLPAPKNIALHYTGTIPDDMAIVL